MAFKTHLPYFSKKQKQTAFFPLNNLIPLLPFYENRENPGTARTQYLERKKKKINTNAPRPRGIGTKPH